jgi:hypothetical protein
VSFGFGKIKIYRVLSVLFSVMFTGSSMELGKLGDFRYSNFADLKGGKWMRIVVHLDENSRTSFIMDENSRTCCVCVTGSGP